MTSEQLHFIWSNFYRSLSHCVQVNYAQKCRLRQTAAGLTLYCETEAVRDFAVSRWKAELERAMMSDVRFETEREESIA